MLRTGAARRGRADNRTPRASAGGADALARRRTLGTATECALDAGSVGVARGSDTLSVKPAGLVFEEKSLQGSYFGSCVPRIDFPRMLGLYMAGKLKLDELITKRYSVEEAPQAFADMQSGKNARGVIVF